MSKVIAILCADLHLSHTPPTARSVEPDWYVAQGRYVRQLRDLSDEYKCPVYIAGDLFDRFNSPPELINWAIEAFEFFKPMCVLGQHDLPYHSMKDVHKSAYQTLSMAGVIDSLYRPKDFGGVVVTPVHWGEEIPSSIPGCSEIVKIVLAHRYIWTQGKQYVGASDDSHWSSLRKQLDGYDVAVFGDNHKPFEIETKDCLIFNCGCLIPRSTDERDHEPSVGLLYDDKHVERHYLDVRQDKWLDLPEQEMWKAQENEKLTKFLDDLKTLGGMALDFHRAVLRFMDENEVDDGVRKALLEAVEGND